MKTEFALAVMMAVGAAGCTSSNWGRHDDDHDEAMEMSLTDLPAAVRDAMNREARGGEIDEIEKSTLNGATVYEAEVEIDGKDWEIVVDASGKLLSKEPEGEEKDDHDDGKDDKEDGDKEDSKSPGKSGGN